MYRSELAVLLFGVLLLGAIIFGLVWAIMHPNFSVLSGVVVDVADEEVSFYQVTKGASFKFGDAISFDKVTWEKKLPITCEDRDVKLVYVRHGDLFYETMIIIQDNQHNCSEQSVMDAIRGVIGKKK